MAKESTYPTASLASGDYLRIVSDPGGTPATKNIIASPALVNLNAGSGFKAVTQTGSPPTYTLLASDFGKTLVTNESSTNYITVPDSLPGNFFFRVLQGGIGSTVIQGNGTSSVSGVLSSGSYLVATGAQNSVCDVIPSGTDSFIVTGSNLTIPPFANSQSVLIERANAERIVMPALSTLLTGANITISIWMKATAAGSVTYHLMGSSLTWYFERYNNASIRLRGWGSDLIWTPVTNLWDLNWHNVTLVQDASNLNIHFDGGSAGSGETKVHPSTSIPSSLRTSLNIGGTYSGRQFDGYVDELYMWDTALGASEVVDLYNSGTPINPAVDSGNYVSSTDLLHGYRLGDGDTSPTVLDIIGGSSYNGTLTNGASIESVVP